MSFFWEELWYNPKFINKKVTYRFFFRLLQLLSFGYKAIIFLRKKAYQHGIFKSFGSKIPVIVVGNLTIGGTGKTPLIIFLAEHLRKKGYHPGIVSRGYGGKSAVYPLLVTKEITPKQAGDEAVLLAERTKCPVVVAPKRAEAVNFLEAQSNCDIILSDDGLQHLAMRRDMEIIVIDGERNFGNGFCLPAGPLRESTKRCKTVDFLIKNSGNKNTTHSCVPYFAYEMNILPETFVHICRDQSFPLNFFEKQSVHVVTGIGNPNRFLTTLAFLKLNYDTRLFPDHHEFTEKNIQFTQKAPIVMTEKDAVKCRYLVSSHDMYYLKITTNIEPTFIAAFFEKLEKIRERKVCL